MYFTCANSPKCHQYPLINCSSALSWNISTIVKQNKWKEVCSTHLFLLAALKMTFFWKNKDNSTPPLVPGGTCSRFYSKELSTLPCKPVSLKRPQSVTAGRQQCLSFSKKLLFFGWWCKRSHNKQRGFTFQNRFLLFVQVCVHLGWQVFETMYGLMEGEEGSGSSHVGVIVEDK